ncbi:phosphonate metabolism transcriptional regulator PhnF [Telmatospirillum sp. J64-1]|uniref:phosphonate metabolism transcriptional regulator PhnF n=1 Tax=Telmatospirillum sp. J64-1 TaxID=2502183 RepID=UPI00115E7BFF|nr:phosphonate metabolism transcriptional regulator PhnF [Telmatospirillum sp. J64-1]
MNSLERGSGIALWRQIQRALESDIVEGRLAPGQQLPTENDLAQRFDVNRHTVRRAMGALEEQGLIRVEQGRGSFVQEHVIDYLVSKRTRFSENLSRQSRSVGGKILRAEVVEADAVVARELKLARGAPVILIERLGEADGRPINVSAHYFPQARFAGLDEVLREYGSITQALRRWGVEDYQRAWTRVTARMPTAEDAHHLQQPRNRPILVTESVNIDDKGKIVEYGMTRFASDWVQLVIES